MKSINEKAWMDIKDGHTKPTNTNKKGVVSLKVKSSCTAEKERVVNWNSKSFLIFLTLRN